MCLSGLDTNGTITYSTYSVEVDDRGHAIAVDSSGNAYLDRLYRIQRFSSPECLSDRSERTLDAFLVKLNSSGASIYASYLAAAIAEGQ